MKTNYICTMKAFGKTSTAYRFLLLILLVLAGLTATSLLYMLILLIHSGFQWEILTGQNQNISLMRMLQGIQACLVFILPSLLLCKIVGESPREYLSLKPAKPMQIVLATVSIWTLIPLVNTLVEWNANMHFPPSLQPIESWMRAAEDQAATLTEQLMQSAAFSDLAANLFVVAILAGIGEELLFRGLIQRMLGPRKSHAAVWITAILFSAIHLQFYGFIPRLLLGVWFGYLCMWTGSIWVPIAAHITNNALATGIAFIEARGTNVEFLEHLGQNDMLWASGVSIALTCLIGYTFYQKFKQATQ